jgi:hypothetical protein
MINLNGYLYLPPATKTPVIFSLVGSDFMKKLNEFYESEVEMARMRAGERQTVETLVNEEALLLAKFLRDEHETWNLRVPKLWKEI